MDRAVLRSYVLNQQIGTDAVDYKQFTMTLHEDGRCICSGVDLQNHIADWNTWPMLSN
jgi:hypothetical protein